MLICQNEDGTWGKYEEPYTTVEFKTEEDYKMFEEILDYYNKRKEHEKEIRNKAIDDVIERINHIDYVPVCVDCLTKHQIIEIAEQLKEGEVDG